MSVDNGDYSDTSEEEDDIDIHYIAREGTVDDMEWSLSTDRNSLLNLKELKSGYSALHCACEVGRKDMITCLIKRGAIVDFRDSKFRTPLMIAANQGKTDICRLLLEKGADIKCKDRECWTSLHHAVEGVHVDTATMLIKRGVELGAEEARFGRTALHFAAELGLHELADMLIIRGSDLYGSGDSIYSKTPLHLACMAGHHQVATVLINRGIDLETTSGFLDMTALHCAADNGHVGCVQTLVEAGADMVAVGFTFNGSTPLHLAAMKGHEDITQYLVNKGASLTMQGKYTTEGTPLHIACQYGKANIVQILVNGGADLEMKDLNGNTAMHTACKHSQFDVALLLISMGADLTAVAGNARFPLELIPPHESYRREELRLAGLNYDREMERKAAEVAKAIRDAEALAEARDLAEKEAARRAELLRKETAKRQSRFCALLMACTNISGELSALTDVITEYPDLDINMELETEKGSRALVRAAYNGFNVIVEALLRWKGIDINVQERDGNTALHMAASRGKLQHKLVVEMLLFARVRTGIPNRAGKLAATIAGTPYLAEVIRDPRLLHSSLASMAATAALTIVQHNKVTDESKLEKTNYGFNYLEQDSVSLGGSSVLTNPVGVLSDPNQGLIAGPNYGGVDGGDSMALSLGATQIMNKDRPWSPGSRPDGTTPYMTFGTGPLEDFHTYSNGVDLHTGKPWELPHTNPLVRPSSPLPLKDDGSVGGLSVESHMGDPTNATYIGTREGTGVFPAITGGGMQYSSATAATLPRQQGTYQGMPESSFQSDKFGPPPRHYSPSTVDMFFIKYQVQNNSIVTTSSVLVVPDHVVRQRLLMSQEGSIASSAGYGAGGLEEEKTASVASLDAPLGLGGPITQFPMQASHTPSAFDSNDEWAEVRDYLWLLGYPYSKAFAAANPRQPLQRGGGRGSTNNLWNTQQQMQANSNSNHASMRDPRSKLYNISVIMNDVQEVFGDPNTGGFHIDYDAQGATILKYKAREQLELEGGDIKLKHFSFDFVQQSVDLYMPFSSDELGLYRGKGGVKAMLKDQIIAMAQSGRISEDVGDLLHSLLELSVAKGLQKVVSKEIKKEIEGMSTEDKPGGGNTQPDISTIKYTPRQRRVMVDAMFDLAQLFKGRAEKDFPSDNIRTRFWVHSSGGKYCERIKFDLSFDLMLWLKDLLLDTYYPNFDELGFRLLDDFRDLSLVDCKEYFPFLKIGDAVRLSKAINHLHPETATAYRERAENKQIAIALPPIPGK
jgi:ankyrin repeat protein